MKPRAYPAKPKAVYLYGTCLIDLFEPQAGLDAARLIEREGVSVHYPQAQSCCGQPAYTSGNPEDACRVAASQMALFSEDWPIVVPSGSCAGMMRHHWPKLFEDDAVLSVRARQVADRVFELTEFLLHVAQARYELPKRSTEKVTLHTSCSARREMGTRDHALSLLSALPGVEVVEHARESECCGFGGTFSLKHPAISGAMVKDKTANIAATGCHKFVTADCGCMLNIRHAAEHQGMPLESEHLATFLWRHTCGDKA